MGTHCEFQVDTRPLPEGSPRPPGLRGLLGVPPPQWVSPALHRDAPSSGEHGAKALRAPSWGLAPPAGAAQAEAASGSRGRGSGQPHLGVASSSPPRDSALLADTPRVSASSSTHGAQDGQAAVLLGASTGPVCRNCPAQQFLHERYYRSQEQCARSLTRQLLGAYPGPGAGQRKMHSLHSYLLGTCDQLLST